MEKIHFLYDPETERRLELLQEIQDRISNAPTHENRLFRKFLVSAIKSTKPKRERPVRLRKKLKLLNTKPLSIKKTLRLVDDKKDFFPNLSGGLYTKIMSYSKNPRVDRISCDGPGYNVVVKYDGKKFESGIVFKDFKEMNEFMVKLVKEHKQRFMPVVDFTIPGFRFHGIFGSEILAPKFIMKRI